MKIILVILMIIVVTGCMSLVPEHRKIEWALESGYILAEDLPEIEVPEREPLPLPIVPIFETVDKDGDPIPITQRYLMTMVVQLFGTIEKFQYLAEIYEREYLNVDGRIMPELSLEELKELYYERLSIIERERLDLVRERDPTVTEGTAVTTLGYQMTREDFEIILELWREMNIDLESVEIIEM